MCFGTPHLAPSDMWLQIRGVSVMCWNLLVGPGGGGGLLGAQFAALYRDYD